MSSVSRPPPRADGQTLDAMVSADDDGPRSPRLTRQQAKARTRSLLLDAAATVFASKGYAGASVDDVADAAGFTTGALYSNFAGKEDLFIELLSRRSGGRMAEALAIFGNTDVPIEQRRSALARHLVAVAEQDDAFALLEAEFWLYAMRRPEFQQRYAAQFRNNRDALSDALGHWAKTHRRSDALPLDELATVLLALFQGLVQLRRTDRDLVPNELYAEASRWLVAGITAVHPATD